jgi:hypothetical protein
MGTFLTKGDIGASGSQTGLAYEITNVLVLLLRHFNIGMIADVFFAQKIFGVLHLIGSVIVFISSQTNFDSFYTLLLFLHDTFLPTLALVNSIFKSSE